MPLILFAANNLAALSFDHLPARGWQALSGVIVVIGGGVLIVSPFDSVAILTWSPAPG